MPFTARLLAGAGALAGGVLAGKGASLLAYSLTTSSLWHTFHRLEALTAFEDGALNGFVTGAVGLVLYSRARRFQALTMERVIEKSLKRVRGDRVVKEFARMNWFEFGKIQTGAVRCGQIAPTSTWYSPLKVQVTYQVWGTSDSNQALVFCDASVSRLTSMISFNALKMEIITFDDHNGVSRRVELKVVSSE